MPLNLEFLRDRNRDGSKFAEIAVDLMNSGNRRPRSLAQELPRTIQLTTSCIDVRLQSFAEMHWCGPPERRIFSTTVRCCRAPPASAINLSSGLVGRREAIQISPQLFFLPWFGPPAPHNAPPCPRRKEVMNGESLRLRSAIELVRIKERIVDESILPKTFFGKIRQKIQCEFPRPRRPRPGTVRLREHVTDQTP